MEINNTLREESFHEEYKWYFLLIFNTFVTFLLIFCAKYQLMPFVDHVIVDATFYEDHVMFSMNRGLTHGFTVLNRFLYSIGPQTFLVYNTVLLLLSIYLCKFFNVFSIKAVSWARAIIAFNPYFIISVFGPSKECNLTFFSLLSIYLFLKGKLIFRLLAIIPVVILVFIRPQFALCLFASYFIYLILLVFKKPMTVCLLILSTYFLLNAIPSINTLIIDSQGGEELPFFAGSNLYEVALFLQVMSQNPVLQIVAFIAKMCLVMFTPVARPNPLTSNYIPLLDWGYTFMANLLFPLNLGFLVLFFSSTVKKINKLSSEAHLLILYCFIGMMSVIVSPSIQFRYLFPYAPFIAACFMLHNVKTRNRILITSLCLLVVVFFVTAIFLPKKWGSGGGGPVFLSWM